MWRRGCCDMDLPDLRGLLRLRAVGLMATRIGRMTLIYADFPDVELTIRFTRINALTRRRVNGDADWTDNADLRGFFPT